MSIRVKIVQLGKGVFPYELEEYAPVEVCLSRAGIPAAGMDVHVNGHPVIPGQRLKNGDLVTIIPRIKGGSSASIQAKI